MFLSSILIEISRIKDALSRRSAAGCTAGRRRSRRREIKTHSNTASTRPTQSRGAGKALPKEIANQIVDRTYGVPLFIEELTKCSRLAGEVLSGRIAVRRLSWRRIFFYSTINLSAREMRR
jgi:hypothetical protein